MRLTSNRPRLVLASVAAVGIAIVGILFVTTPVPRLPTSGPAVVGKAIRTGAPEIGGPFTLVSTNGETVTYQSFRGKWLLIFFGYTSCPDLCPTALTNVSVALEKFGADTRQLQPLFVTVDPQRDTRDVMADYLKSFDSADSRVDRDSGADRQRDQGIPPVRRAAEIRDRR
ncbi:SCO family protein [Bradyrhizobium sp. RDT10]